MKAETARDLRCPVCREALEQLPEHGLCPHCGARLVAASAPPDASPQDVVVARPPAPSPHDTVVAHPPAAGGALAADEAELARAHAEGDAVVAVIGFADSGKTFFVNRLRHELGRAAAWRCREEPRAEIPVSPEGLELSHLFHDRRRLGRTRTRPVLLADLAGESFLGAFRRDAFARLDDAATRPYRAAITLASAYVLVLPAADLVPEVSSPRRHAEFERLMFHFDTIICTIAIAAYRLGQGADPARLLEEGIPAADVETARRGSWRDPVDRPIAIAFSRADLLQAAHPDPGDFDADPLLFALGRARTLVHRVHAMFRYWRADFVSAFAGLPDTTRADYTLPAWGALPTVDWIERTLARPRGRLGAPARLAGGHLPTRWALRMRRAVDPAFRAAWRQANGGGS